MQERMVFSKFDLGELIEMGAWRFSMKTPSGSMYDIEPALGFVSEKLREKVLQGHGFRDAKKLSGSIGDICMEILHNAASHGNRMDPSKSLSAYFLWEEHPSGNAVLTLAVQDQGNGFDVDNPIIRNRYFGNEGLAWARQVMDFVYNFRDSAVYMKKVMRRYGAEPLFPIAIRADLTREPIGWEHYVGRINYRPGLMCNRPHELTMVHVFDIHALERLWTMKGNVLVPRNGAAIETDLWEREKVIEEDIPHVAVPYLSVGMPIEARKEFYSDALFVRNMQPALERKFGRPMEIYTNSLFYNSASEEVVLSAGLSLKFLRIKEQVVEFYRQLQRAYDELRISPAT